MGSVVDNWYLSAKIPDGRVRYVWREQVVSGREGGGLSVLRGIDMVIVGCRPVGGAKETAYVLGIKSSSPSETTA